MLHRRFPLRDSKTGRKERKGRMLDRITKEKSVVTVCFRSLQKPERGHDFNDKWILIKRVPEEIVRALRFGARYALTMNLIRSSPFIRERPSRFHLRFLSYGRVDLSGNLSGLSG